MSPSDRRSSLARARGLAGALLWRMRRERLSSLFTSLIPYVLLLVVTIVLPIITGDRGINGAAASATFGVRYGVRHDPVDVGMMLFTAPAMNALFSTVGASLAVRAVVGGEAGRGGIEALLAAPYTPGAIAAGLLGWAFCVATLLSLTMNVLAVAAIVITLIAHHDTLRPDGAYVAMGVGLPLLSAWAGAALALSANLTFPRLARAGQTGVAGGGQNVGGFLAILPGIGVLIAISLGAAGVGALRLLLYIGGGVTAIAVVSVVTVARFFRPESVLES